MGRMLFAYSIRLLGTAKLINADCAAERCVRQFLFFLLAKTQLRCPTDFWLGDFYR